MRTDEQADAIIRGLHEAGVEFVIVGGMAAVLQRAPVLTEDLDIVHRRTPENVARLLEWLLAHGAYPAEGPGRLARARCDARRIAAIDELTRRLLAS